MLHNVRDELLTLLYRLPPIAYRTLFKIRCADPHSVIHASTVPVKCKNQERHSA
jgi:hypothetical protein